MAKKKGNMAVFGALKSTADLSCTIQKNVPNSPSLSRQTYDHVFHHLPQEKTSFVGIGILYIYINKMYFRAMCISILCIFMPNDWTLRNAIEYEHPPVMLEFTNVGVTRHTWNYTSLLLGNPSIS